MARKYFRGGANALRGQGSPSDDGNWDYDTVTADSNWVDDTGTGCAKPTGSDEAIFSEFAETVPSDYSQAAEPHEPGKHFSCCAGLAHGSGGDDLELNGLTFTPGYDPGNGKGLFGWVAKNLDATETDPADAGASTLIYCTANGFAVGDYVTIGGTVLLNGEFRIKATTTDTFTIPLAYKQETPPTSATAVARKPLRVGISANYEIQFGSNCTAYIEASHDTLNIEYVDFNSASGLLHLSSDVVGSHNFNEIRVRNNGTLIMAPNAEFTKIIMTKDGPNATVEVGTGCLGPSAVSCDLEMDAGNCAWDSKAGDLDINGGMLIYCKNVGLSTQVNIDVINMFGDGVVEWWGKSRLYDFDVRGGTLTAKGSGVKSIDSGTTKDFPLRGGTVDLSQATGPITLGTNNKIDKQGGALEVPDRALVEF